MEYIPKLRYEFALCGVGNALSYASAAQFTWK